MLDLALLRVALLLKNEKSLLLACCNKPPFCISHSEMYHGSSPLCPSSPTLKQKPIMHIPPFRPTKVQGMIHRRHTLDPRRKKRSRPIADLEEAERDVLDGKRGVQDVEVREEDCGYDLSSARRDG